MAHAETVNAWFNERLRCGALARDTDAYNQVFAALGDLIARLDPAPPPAAEPQPDAAEPA